MVKRCCFIFFRNLYEKNLHFKICLSSLIGTVLNSSSRESTLLYRGLTVGLSIVTFKYVNIHEFLFCIIEILYYNSNS